MSIIKKLLNTKSLLILILLLASLLRLYRLSIDPPSLFGDELDLGYQAYSILKTGNDYRGNFLPINFHSLAEWRAPLYLYSAVPAVAVFGISPLGVRLPAAIFGILDVLVVFMLFKEILSYKQPPTDKHWHSLLAAFLFAISPWALQYSRAGFEVTEMLFFLMLGLYLFFLSFKDSKWLWVSILLLVLTPWIYSTAKLFTLLLLTFLLLVFRKEIFSMQKKNLIKSAIAGLVVGLPLVYGILLGGGAQRFNDISVFADPTTNNQIGIARDMVGKMEGKGISNLSLSDKLFYNKFTFWGNNILQNYLSAFSTQFLFIKGDPNPRQSVGLGELFRIEIIPLLIGLAFFFLEKGRDVKIKFLMGFWLIAGALPSALTVDGGNHATRLILLLPPLLFFIAFGLVSIYKFLGNNWQKIFLIISTALYLISMVLYFHEYYGPYVWNSEHWWDYGWKQGITDIKAIDQKYDRVFISMSNEPAWIFFAGYYQYSPSLWQKNFPIGNDVIVDGFGKISHTGKFYFGSPDSKVQIYGLGRYLTDKDLYLANAGEDGDNLIIHPDKAPPGLKLLDAIPFPSGEPAFYLFSGEK